VHPANTTAAYRGRTTALPRPFRFGFAPGRVVGALHGVDGHFDFAQVSPELLAKQPLDVELVVTREQGSS